LRFVAAPIVQLAELSVLTNQDDLADHGETGRKFDGAGHDSSQYNNTQQGKGLGELFRVRLMEEGQ
jgi:hypothetical protein